MGLSQDRLRLIETIETTQRLAQVDPHLPIIGPALKRTFVAGDGVAQVAPELQRVAEVVEGLGIGRSNR